MATANLKKMLKGLKDAKVSKKGNYLTEGRYLLKVKSTVTVEPFEGPEAFVSEFEVVESSSPAHPVGAERSWYQSFKFQQTAQSELKKFTYAILGLDMSNPEHAKLIEEKVDPQIEPMLEDVIGNNRFAGKLVRCEVVTRESKKKTDKDGNPTEYSQYIFSPATPAATTAAA